MALLITVASSVNAPTSAPVSTNTVRVTGVYYNFDNTVAYAVINYGNTDANGAFTPIYTETWKLSGAYYGSRITAVTSGGAIAGDLLANVTATVNDILGTAGKKDALIASGELIVTPTNRLRMFL